MAETTQVRPDKVRAALTTDYRLGRTERDIILKFGVRSDRLHNPQGAKQDAIVWVSADAVSQLILLR